MSRYDREVKKQRDIQNDMEAQTEPATLVSKAEPQQNKVSKSALEAALKEKGVTAQEFAVSNEDRRKTILGDKYEQTKAECGWLYDQPIQL